ncbi:cysteine hydrolase family protein [Enterovibrio calviensis]|uniref:cysteine hydrolase family protein n=1 Tax=Enterovibrio calviensis TaxID=91359 RepID=UPI003735C7B0
MLNALIVIDFINDIVHPQGKIPSCALQVSQKQVIENANVAIRWARAHHHLLVFIKVGFHPSYQDQPKRSPMFGKANEIGALKLDAWGTQFHDDLDVQDSDLVVVKPRVNPFFNTSLDSILRANQIDSVFLCGVSTGWAIESAARDAHDRDYSVHIVADACTAHSEDEHQTSLQLLERIATLHQASLLNE